MVSSLRASALTCLAALLVVSAACGGSSDDGRSDVGPLERMLQVIPDTEVNRRSILIQDYARIRELNGMPVPSGPANANTIIEYLRELLRVDRSEPDAILPFFPPFISFGDLNEPSFLLPEDIGYSFMDVDQDVLAGFPPNESMAASGRIDFQMVNQVIRGCDACPTPDEVRFNGVVYFSWGEDFAMSYEDRLTPPAFDRLGQGGRVATVDGFVMRALWTEGIEGMIDAYRGEGSLADNPDVRAAIRALDERNVFAAHGTDRPSTVESITMLYESIGFREGSVWPPPENEPLLRVYRFLMVGASLDEFGQFFWLVLVHESPDLARENARLLPLRVRETDSFLRGRPWADFIEIEELEVSGRLLIAKIRGEKFPGHGSFFWLDPLLVHESPE